jgi:hypothetical protein
VSQTALQKSCEESDDDSSVDSLLKNKNFMDRVRTWLKTEEQKAFFDFIRDVPMAFAMEHAGERWTEEKIAFQINIPVERIPSLKKSLKRAFKKQLRIFHLEH